MFHFDYLTQGTCAKLISFDLDGEQVRNIVFTGGCDGNLKAISRMLEGATLAEMEPVLEGITCGRKATSCTDQLVRALRAGLIARNDPDYVSPLDEED